MEGLLYCYTYGGGCPALCVCMCVCVCVCVLILCFSSLYDLHLSGVGSSAEEMAS